MFLWLSGRALRWQRKRLWVQFQENTHTDKKCISWMHCATLWIKVSDKCINVKKVWEYIEWWLKLFGESVCSCWRKQLSEMPFCWCYRKMFSFNFHTFASHTLQLRSNCLRSVELLQNNAHLSIIYILTIMYTLSSQNSLDRSHLFCSPQDNAQKLNFKTFIHLLHLKHSGVYIELNSYESHPVPPLLNPKCHIWQNELITEAWDFNSS